MRTHLEELAEKYPKMAERARTSRKAAIRMFCLDCVGGQPSEVRKCVSTNCPLYPFRMGVREDGSDEEEE